MESIRLHESGVSPNVILLLGGMAMPLSYVEPLAKDLARSHRIIVPCFHGYGDTPRASSPYTIEQQQVALEDALVAAGATTLVAVGTSLGSYRAALLAATSTRVSVSALALFGGFAALTDEDRAQYVQFAAMVRANTVPPGLLSMRFLSERFRTDHPERASEVGGWLTQLNPEGVAMELEAVARCADIRPLLSRVRAPAGVRVGDADAATPVAVCRELASAMLEAKLEIVPDAGHLLFLEDYAASLLACQALST